MEGRDNWVALTNRGLRRMVALIALILILAIFGGLGFAAHVLWYVLIFAVLLWLIGFFVGGVEGGGRHWYGRW
jgi:energy-coupling factor transporter transmembrane protein EcfT